MNKKWSFRILFLIFQLLKALIERGPDFLMELFRLAMNEAMKMERENFLNAGAYERRIALND